MSWSVELTPEEVAAAEAVGELQHHWISPRANPLGHLSATAPAEQRRQGCAGEIAVARCLGVPWEPIIGAGDRAAPDVGGWHVRSTEYENGHLLLHDDSFCTPDPDEDRYVLVIGRRPVLRLVGWCWGWEGKQEKFWRVDCRVPCYFVPQEALHPVRADIVESRHAAS